METLVVLINQIDHFLKRQTFLTDEYILYKQFIYRPNFFNQIIGWYFERETIVTATIIPSKAWTYLAHLPYN